MNGQNTTSGDQMIEHENSFKPWGMDINQFCTLMHVAIFAGYIVPGAGLALPVVMWAMNKEQSELIDANGKNLINWMISMFLYGFIGLILSFAVIGIPILVILGLLGVILPLIAAVKASSGEVYKYPLTINIIK